MDEVPLRFGRHKGKSPSDIAGKHPSYIVWAYENVTSKGLISGELYQACLADVELENELSGMASGCIDWWRD